MKEAYRVNFWFNPISGVQQDVAIKGNESVAMLLGRLLADILSAVLVAYEFTVGVGGILGGLAACGLGTATGPAAVIPCSAGAVAAVAGVLLVGQGVMSGARALEGMGTIVVALSRRSGEEGPAEWRPLGVEDLPDSYVPPRGGPRKVTVQDGPYKGRVGWLDEDGNIWVPTKPGESHGGPHWDVQLNGGKGGHLNVPPK